MAIESTTNSASPVSTAKTTQTSKASNNDKVSDSSNSFKDEMDMAASTSEHNANADSKLIEKQQNTGNPTQKSGELADIQYESINMQNNLLNSGQIIGKNSPYTINGNNLVEENQAINNIEKGFTSVFDGDYKQANDLLESDIEQMMTINPSIASLNLDSQSLNSIDTPINNYDIRPEKTVALECSYSFNTTQKSHISLSSNDAEFFVDMAQSQENDNAGINIQNISAYANNLVESGADVNQTQKSAKVSETLLNALNTARETNQPLRIDFDQNISVILRVNKDGVISANFIPGDKAVEQYLRNNIEMLKNSFDENNLPYSDLSYSNSSKEQNRRRRNQNQQGE